MFIYYRWFIIPHKRFDRNYKDAAQYLKNDERQPWCSDTTMMRPW